jgi:uncharacterized protein
MNTQNLTPFHLAFNVTDLETARAFYGGVLGCQEGRSTQSWVDFSFFGHQISLHLGEPFPTRATGKVGEHMVPMPHFGVVLHQADWEKLATSLCGAQQEFIIAPTTRFKGEVGEQSTMFFLDPFGNPIEIKGIANMQAVFAA